MALSLIIDHSLAELIEPGFFRFYPTRQLAESGNPSDDASNKGIWRDEPTKTLMLRPLQLDSTWLNTTKQLESPSSVIRLDDMQVNASDLSNLRIFEQPVGNTANPYIWHEPVGPASFFPAAPPSEPGAPPSVVGVATPVDAGSGLSVMRLPNDIYAVPSIMPPAGSPPTPSIIGGTSDGKFLAHTKARIAANQALFFRWHHPASQIGFPCTYEFYVAQYRLRIKDVVVEILKDTSTSGDRTSWKKVMTAPLFSVGDFSASGTGSVMSVAAPEAALAHDRSLLWLPYRRHQVLLYSSANKWAVLTVRPTAQRLTDDSDWDITREDTILVWVQTPAPGRFQIQKVKYPSGTIKVQSPTVTLDYTPSVAPTITLAEDTDHGATLTAARTQPPSYTLPVNDANDCPTRASDPATDQSRTYGVELSFTASSDKRWTPFFYGFSVAASRTFGARPTTPFTINDVGTAAYYLQEATISAGRSPGAGRLTAKIVDKSPYTLSPYYYRSYYPVQLTSNGTAVFTGWSEPNEVTPLKESSLPRQLTFSALDRWKQLTDSGFLQDQRDWSGFGHISVVLFMMQQAGVDTTSAVTPPLTTRWNTPLGLGQNPMNVESGDIRAPWKPRDDDTAATYIQRVVDLFSGWDVGFYPDGVPFYLPSDYYTTPTVTFYAETATAPGGAPKFRNATFRTIEPEANVIVVMGGSAADGGVRHSATWVDWASLRNKNAVNYIGKQRAEAIIVGGGFTCSQLNYIGRQVFQQTRRRHVTVEFEADFAPTLKVGHVCTLGSYGDYRIQDYQVEFVKNAWRPARYTGELLELGYGVP